MDIQYGLFPVKEIFPKVKTLKKYAAIPDSEGDIPFISSSSMNNGVSGYVGEVSFNGKCITVSTNGKCFDCFYHDGKIAISSDVELLTNNNINEFSALYICSVLNMESFKWGYGRKPKNDKVFETTIRLPIKTDGTPDWLFMENYIREFTSKQYSFGTIDNCQETKNSSPKPLRIYNKDKRIALMEFEKVLGKKPYKGKAYAKVDLDISEYKRDGYLPFVSRTENNNGVDCYVKADDSFAIEKGNCIIIGDTTSTIFYQDSDFVCGDHIVVCRAPWLNKYTALYIKTLLNKERYRYSYGRAFKMDFIQKTILAIPVNENGEPDWEYMENYIKSLPYSDRI